MSLTRKQFLEITAKAAAGAAVTSFFASPGMADSISDIRNSQAVRKIHEHIARE